jgi:hypothetical protein
MGKQTEPVRLLSAAISEPIERAYRTGGFGLAFLFLGALFMLVAPFVPNSLLTLFLATVGFLLIVAVGSLFFFKELRPLARAERVTAQNKEMIDAV